MPSLGDSAVIIFLGLLLFGPKGLAQIARQLGKLMGEFRRASNEFRMQMEEELRISEQADRQKEIAAIQAAAPTTPLMTAAVDETLEEHPHMRTVPAADAAIEPVQEPTAELAVPSVEPEAEVAPVPIATSGDLNLMPPASGLPSPRKSTASSASLGPLIESVPHVDAQNGHATDGSEHKPMRYTNGHHEENTAPAADTVSSAAAAESVHG